MQKNLVNYTYYKLLVDSDKNRAYPIIIGNCIDLSAVLEYKRGW